MQSMISDILSRRQAAEFLGICRTTLDRLDIPRIKIRRRILFRREILLQWLDEHTDNVDRRQNEQIKN